MKSRRSFLAVLLAAVLIAPAFALADDAKDMEGNWTVSEAESDGTKIEADELKEVKVKITGDKYVVESKDNKETGSMKLDTAAKPKTMDVTPADGPNAGKVVKAIYELEGDKLRVCYMLGDGARPTEFSTTAGGTLMITYKREKKEK